MGLHYYDERGRLHYQDAQGNWHPPSNHQSFAPTFTGELSSYTSSFSSTSRFGTGSKTTPCALTSKQKKNQKKKRKKKRGRSMTSFNEGKRKHYKRLFHIMILSLTAMGLIMLIIWGSMRAVESMRVEQQAQDACESLGYSRGSVDYYCAYPEEEGVIYCVNYKATSRSEGCVRVKRGVKDYKVYTPFAP